jgi:hypothetical protein
MILVTPKVGAKLELLFNELASASEVGLLNKSSCLSSALGMTKFITIIAMFLVALCCATQVPLRCSTNQPLMLQLAKPVSSCSDDHFSLRLSFLDSMLLNFFFFVNNVPTK